MLSDPLLEQIDNGRGRVHFPILVMGDTGRAANKSSRLTGESLGARFCQAAHYARPPAPAAKGLGKKQVLRELRLVLYRQGD